MITRKSETHNLPTFSSEANFFLWECHQFEPLNPADSITGSL
uniref:Uncharacterized protein n=1 Tax=Rhizophora mucronata TaxID=61149 RepID=A0A2P2QWM8_RHIMU